jgi:hypothetical protein
MRGVRGVFRAKLNMLRTAARFKRWPGLGFVCILFAEYKRSTLAAQRYEELRRMNTTMLVRMDVHPPDPSRRVFDEIYSGGNDANGAAWRESSERRRWDHCPHSRT